MLFLWEKIESAWAAGDTVQLVYRLNPHLRSIAYESDKFLSLLIYYFFVIFAGMAVYNVFIVCAIGVPMAIYSEKQEYEISFYVITVCIVFCTTVTLCLVFVPKVCSSY